MERLTIRTSKGAALNMADSYRGEAEARADLMQRYRIAVERLAAYEDTGLEPEEIRGTLDHLRELIQAEQDGRLVALPCKIGTEVYAVYTSVRGTNPTVYKMGFSYGLIPHWGKAVFATREEAEAALAAQKGGGEG